MTRFRWYSLGGLVLAGLLIAIWQSEYDGRDPRQILFPPPPRTLAFAPLAAPVSIQFVERPLNDVVAELSRRHNVPITLIPAEFAAVGATGRERVSIDVSEVRLESVVNHLIRQVSPDLCLRQRDDQLFVTTPAGWSAGLANYAVHTHSLNPVMGLAGRLNETDLAETLEVATGMNGWVRQGGIGEIHVLPGGFLIKQLVEQQREIERLLRAFQTKRTANSLEPIWVHSAPSAHRRAVFAALDNPIDIDYDGVSLNTVAEDLSDRLKIRVVLDLQALAQLGISDELAVTGRARGVALRDALHLLLPNDVRYAVWNESLLITTRDHAPYMTAVYPVADLMAVVDEDWQVTELVGSAFADFSNPSGIKSAGDCIVVHSTLEGHEEVSRRLQIARRTLATRGQGVTAPSSTAGAGNIEQALRSPVDWDFQANPFSDVVHAIEQQFAINVMVDYGALKDIGIAYDSTVDGRYASVSLRNALTRLLNDLDLTFLVQHGVLRITTPEAAEEEPLLSVRGYFVLPASVDYLGIADGDALTELLTSTVAPWAWDSGSGPSPIGPAGPLLVMEQSQYVHQRAKWTLEALAEGMNSNVAGAESPSGRGDFSIVAGTAEDRAVWEKLRRPLGFPVAEKPLTDVVARLADRHHVPVWIDRPALSDIGRDASLKVSWSQDDEPLQSALEGMLAPHGLSYRVRLGGIEITGVQEYRQTLKVYPLEDLIEGGTIRSAEELAGAVSTLLWPSDWSESGGQAIVQGYGNVLLVSQAPGRFPAVDRFVATLRHPTWRGRDLAIPQLGPADGLQPLLERRVTFAAQDLPLQEVVADIARQSSVVIEVDPSLAERKITAMAARVPLADALELLLEPLNARHAVLRAGRLPATSEPPDKTEGVAAAPAQGRPGRPSRLTLRITNSDRAVGAPPIAFLPVDDLKRHLTRRDEWTSLVPRQIRFNGETPNPSPVPLNYPVLAIRNNGTRQNPFATLIDQTVFANYRNRPSQVAVLGSVVATSHGPTAQLDLRDMLARVRQSCRRTATLRKESTDKLLAVDPSAMSGDAMDIEKTLTQPIQLDVTDATLFEIAVDLSQRYGVAIWFDLNELEDAAGRKGAQRRFTRSLKDVPLDQTLTDLVDELEPFAVVAHRNTVRVTFEKTARRRYQARVYDISDLADRFPPTQLASMPSMLRELVYPYSWIDPDWRLESAAIGQIGSALIVNQTRQGHRRLAVMLAALRANPRWGYVLDWAHREMTYSVTENSGDLAPRDELLAELPKADVARRYAEMVLARGYAERPQVVAHFRQQFEAEAASRESDDHRLRPLLQAVQNAPGHYADHLPTLLDLVERFESDPRRQSDVLRAVAAVAPHRLADVELAMTAWSAREVREFAKQVQAANLSPEVFVPLLLPAERLGPLKPFQRQIELPVPIARRTLKRWKASDNATLRQWAESLESSYSDKPR